MSKSLYQTNVENRAPLTTDAGVVGNWWIDKSASPVDVYLCTDDTGGVYTWTKQGSSGGSGKYLHQVMLYGNNNLSGVTTLISTRSTTYSTIAQIAGDMKGSGVIHAFSGSQITSITGTTTIYVGYSAYTVDNTNISLRFEKYVYNSGNSNFNSSIETVTALGVSSDVIYKL